MSAGHRVLLKNPAFSGKNDKKFVKNPEKISSKSARIKYFLVRFRLLWEKNARNFGRGIGYV